MSRKSLERRRLAQERWPLLNNWLARYFGQDFEIIDGSLSGAIEKASHDGSIEHRRAVLNQWLDWNTTEGAVDDIRPLLKGRFGVEIWFETALEARLFMNRLYDGLKSSLRAAVL